MHKITPPYYFCYITFLPFYYLRTILAVLLGIAAGIPGFRGLARGDINPEFPAAENPRKFLIGPEEIQLLL